MQTGICNEKKTRGKKSPTSEPYKKWRLPLPKHHSINFVTLHAAVTLELLGLERIVPPFWALTPFLSAG
jgi:hypothetical protein